MAHKVIPVEGPCINDKGTSRGRGPDEVAEAIRQVYDIAEELGEIVARDSFSIPGGDASNTSGTDVMFYVIKLNEAGAN